MFERVLIANRGEIAVRIASTLRRLGCSPAAIVADEDPARLHVRSCDVAVAVDSYLDVAAVVAAARECGAQAIHPGYGFLSERAELARACEAAGLVWIGPPAAAIALMGDKAAAREAAVAAGVPVVPGADPNSREAVEALAAEHGWPLLVKAAAGGGGRGMRLAGSLEELDGALEAARREAQAAFGDGALLVEAYLSPARHIEVQVLADAHGTVVALGERECSLQRRHQKVIEEAPSPAVDEALRAELEAQACALAAACGYRGAGTVEFVADAADPARHFFLEMNTRLQVEHAVTEALYGVDLVEWQLRVAAGEALATFGPPRGHAVEARIYAEDPAHGFLPAAGTIRALRLARGEGVRVDAGVAAGEAIGTRYDPMIAKLIAHGATRPQALARLRGALRESAVLGLRSNIAFLLALVEDPDVVAGRLDTGLIERLELADGVPAREAAARVALLASSAAGADVFAALGAWRVGGEPAAVKRVLRVDGEKVSVAIGDARVLEADGEELLVSLDGRSERWLVARDAERVWVASGGRSFEVSLHARARESEAAGDSDVRAPMPGSVVAVHAREGSQVARGDVLLVLESMKMELQITAPHDGRVAAVHVAVGDQVPVESLLASMESSA
ncbi:MAG TPA: biotin carboxylase N-terminal domain-containing protein [Solirubrobacteraceae bacterium]|jgi:acetyl-CoA/propionyl-CoA carboxylase biotin carboxyl carrier protein|nr:biotin carboxylase N-terminal domain-containing protein [Solirubrobacteraceae bacterium]